MRIFFFKHYKGICVCFIISALGFVLDKVIPVLGWMTTTICVGIFFGNFFSFDSARSGVQFVEKKMLSIAIMLLGLELQIEKLASLSLQVVAIILSTILLTIMVSLCIGYVLRVPRSLSLLLGIGNAICGSSAIIASGSLITNKREEIGVSLGLIQLMSTISLLMVPSLLIVFEYYPIQFFSVLLGGSLQAVGHVVAASHLLQTEGAELAMTVKMGRVLFLIPLMLSLSTLNFKKNCHDKKLSIIGVIPIFIFGFVLCAVIRYMHVLPNMILNQVKQVNQYFIVLSMAAIGFNISLKELKRSFSKGFILVTLVFIIQVVFLYVCLRHTFL